MKSPSQQRRAYGGPVFLSLGFRPFFMFAGIWAVLAMGIWLAVLISGQDLPSRMSGADWHQHEMVFGYTSAVIAGFLLTAVPNWTKRAPLIGLPLAALFGLWLLGRLALIFSLYLPAVAAPVIDMAFLAALIFVIGREIIAGNNKRNLKILIILGLLLLANGVYHFEAMSGGAARGYGIRFGVAMIMMLIMVVGGRIVPSFTRNWLSRRGEGRLPIPFGRFDLIALVSAALVLATWTVVPEHWAVRLLAALAALLHFMRVPRWAGLRAAKEPLVLSLHIAYLFVPVGFAVLALGDDLPGWSGASRVPHAWTAGAIGVMTLAVMTRASLGHSGRPLKSTRGVTMIYAFVVAAVLARMGAEIMDENTVLLYSSAALWLLAFTSFTAVYFPLFTKPRI